ncbi:MAG: amidohydrolase family protein [Oscillospiraceae bacterium]
MIIDAHAHIFPDKIAERAVEGIGGFYGLQTRGDGTLSSLLSQGEKAGIGRFLVQSVATVPEQVQSINNFISASVKQYPDKLVGFGAIHPDYPDISGEIERIISLGLKGIKLHSDFQQFNLDDERAFPIYEAAQGRLPILFHIGDSRYDYSAPERLMNVVKRFPKLTVIAAHLAGWTVWERAEALFAGKGLIYADCSSSLYAMTPERGAELIRRLGTDRVMFGTDYPVWDAAGELERFNRLPLSEAEREAILCGNFIRLFGE